MKWRTFDIKREPGFRFNLTDMVFLTLLVALSMIIYSIGLEKGLFLLPLYVGLTFFLFCNVFRIGNNLEPFWYIPFLGIFMYGFYFKDSFWPIVLLTCEPLKIGLIIYRIKRGNYIGIFHRQLARFGN
ncbi:MAG: hypothetical protein V3V59_02185 [Thermodesulfovibrionales bacterium]